MFVVRTRVADGLQLIKAGRDDRLVNKPLARASISYKVYTIAMPSETILF